MKKLIEKISEHRVTFILLTMIALLVLGGLSMGCSQPAHADPTISKPTAASVANYARAGAPFWGRKQNFAAATTCFLDADGGNAKLIPFDALATLSCADRVSLFYSQDFRATIDTTNLAITDPDGPNGQGASFEVNPNGGRDAVLFASTFRDVGQITRRTSFCSGADYPKPCNAADDCPTSADCRALGSFLCSGTDFGTPCTSDAQCPASDSRCKIRGQPGGAYLCGAGLVAADCSLTVER